MKINDFLLGIVCLELTCVFSTTQAQGRYAASFSNLHGSAGLDAPVFNVDWTPLLGDRFRAQLWVGESDTTMTATSVTSAFSDVGDASGLFPELSGTRGHAAGWGDADGNGWPDLYVATFHTSGSKPNRFFRNTEGKFQLDDQAGLRISTRASGVLFADFDNDSDLDLYVTSMPAGADSRIFSREGHTISPCSLFRNEGDGRFTDVSRNNGACPPAFGGRSATVLDFDGDGLLDLLVGEDPVPGYNGSETRSSRLFRNEGDLQFEDVSRAAGLPDGVPGLGVAAADVNNDTWPDFFIASHDGGNRLFLNDGRGRFDEARDLRDTFAWPDSGGDNMVCGICFGDVNNDGLLDAVVGQHFERPWREPVANRLFLNRGVENGQPRFEDVTAAAGLVPLPLKAPHVEIQDFDNDGWPDIYASIVTFAGGEPFPLIFKNGGVWEGVPKFSQEALAANDFPTTQDRAIRRSGEFFEKMVEEKKIVYTAAGPSVDFNRDGRLDLFLANWWIESRSLLLENRTKSGHWLDVRIAGGQGVNRMGIGSRVKIYKPGRLGESAALLGCREIGIGYGYASGQEAVAHFGLGENEECDLEVILPHRHGRITRSNVKANQRITIER